MAKSEVRKSGRPKLDPAKVAEVRRKIADVAGRLFRDEGYDSVSMRRIAKELKLAPMTLYQYFPSKLAMLSVLWAEVFDEVFEIIEAEASGIPDGREKLAHISWIYVDYWLQNRENYHLVFMSSGLSRDDVRSFVETGSIVSKFEIFSESLSAFERPDNTRKKILDQLICCLHGIMHSIITMPGYPWTDANELTKSVVKSVFPHSADTF